MVLLNVSDPLAVRSSSAVGRLGTEPASLPRCRRKQVQPTGPTLTATVTVSTDGKTLTESGADEAGIKRTWCSIANSERAQPRAVWTDSSAPTRRIDAGSATPWP
jgi:hypothetical protein